MPTMAGRREDQVFPMARLAWVGMLALILVGSLAFGWYVRPQAA
jgi:hypothetical protein